jgi:hypothetical protein
MLASSASICLFCSDSPDQWLAAMFKVSLPLSFGRFDDRLNCPDELVKSLITIALLHRPDPSVKTKLSIGRGPGCVDCTNSFGYPSHSGEMLFSQWRRIKIARGIMLRKSAGSADFDSSVYICTAEDNSTVVTKDLYHENRM